MTASTRTPAIVLAIGLAAPLIIGGALAIAALARSPLEAGAAPQPTVATVGRAERLDTQATKVHWIPADQLPVRSQSTGVVTAVSISAGIPVKNGDTVMTIGASPIVAYISPAPLYRNLSRGMTGKDVNTAQRLLVECGYLRAVTGQVDSATLHAFVTFNAAHGHGRSNSLSVGSLFWVPKGSQPPQKVAIRVGDALSKQQDVYTTSLTDDQVSVSTTAGTTARNLSVASVQVVLPAGKTIITKASDVQAIHTAMASQTSAAATLTATVAREVGTVPAAAVITDDAGKSCYFAGVGGAPVVVAPDASTFGLVDVPARLIGSPVLVNPRQSRNDLSCG